MVGKVQRGCHHPCSMSFQWLEDQSSDSQHGHFILHWVFQRVKVRIEDKLLLCFFLFGLFPCLCSGYDPCLRFYLARKGENHPSEIHHCLLTSLSCLSFLWTTKQSAHLTTIHDLVLVHRQRMLFRSFWIFFYLFLCLFLFFSSTGGPCIVWTVRHTHCRPISKSIISHHQCGLVRRLLHLWPTVQSRLQHNLPR